VKRASLLAGVALLPVGAALWWAGLGVRFELEWPDRRPIGALFLSSSGHTSQTNPRGWLNDPRLDVTKPEGRKVLHMRFLEYAARSVGILREMNAQGMVVWDLEGQQTDGYTGDPRLAETLAPEWRGVLDAFFARFREAGLRVGVTVRPERYDGRRQRFAWDPARVLREKVGYARARWGATLFYVDSNRVGPVPLPAAVLRSVAKEFPDVLLIPEHEMPGDYAVAAPLWICGRSYGNLAPLVRTLWPRAFGVVALGDCRMEEHQEEWRRAVRAGDVLLFPAWFAARENAWIRELYEGAK